MKKFLQILMLAVFLAPTFVLASGRYESKNLEETLKEEAELSKNSETPFEYDLSNYKESDDQITIYLFRGKGCAYCKKFLTFLNSIVGEYGKYFKLESYEVWHDANNGELLDEVSEFLDEDAGGVPYIVIGDQVFPGYASQYDEGIKKAILDLYNSKDRYDVFEEMERAKKLEKIQAMLPYVINAGAIVISTAVIIVYMNNNNKKLNEQLTKISKELKEVKKLQVEKEEVKESKTKKATKKVTKKIEEK